MPESKDLLALLQEQEEPLLELVEAAQAGDEVDLANATFQLLRALIVPLPVVGALLDMTVRETIARSAYGRVQGALADLEAEQDQAERARVTAEAVAEVLAPALAMVVGRLEDVRTRVIEQEQRWQAERAARGKVSVKHRVVKGGIGVEVKTGFDQDVDVVQDEIHGGVGVKLG